MTVQAAPFIVQGSGVSGRDDFGVESPIPDIYMKDTLASANNKFWDWLANGGTMHFRAVDDANSNATDYMAVTRSGILISNIRFAAQDFDFDAGGGNIGSIDFHDHNFGSFANLSYSSGWATNNGSFPAGARKIGDLTQLCGRVKRTSGSGTSIGFLPSGVGCWTTGMEVPVRTNTGAGAIQIDAAGEITLIAGGSGWVDLEGVIFRGA